MRIARWILLTAIATVSACAGAQPATPAATTPPVVMATHQPITVQSPLTRAFGLAIGAQWVYQTDRSDACVGRGVSKTARGAITETITSAWQLGEAQVFELRVESCLLGKRLETTEYYVILNEQLYRIAGQPETFVQGNARGCEAMLLAKWPATTSQTFGGGGKGAWRVVDQSPLDWAGGRAETCAHLQRRSTNSEEEIWLCEGLGVVRQKIQEFGQRINQEEKTLTAKTSAATP